MSRRTRASLYKRALRASGGYFQSWVALATHGAATDWATKGEAAVRNRAAYAWLAGYYAGRRDARLMMQAAHKAVRS